MLDERWIRSLHVESLRAGDLHAERSRTSLFQASTIGALLDGAYDGDLSFAELAEHGDLGLGDAERARRRDDRARRQLLPRRRRRRGRAVGGGGADAVRRGRRAFEPIDRAEIERPARS